MSYFTGVSFVFEITASFIFDRRIFHYQMPMLDLGWIVGSMVKAYVALSRVSAYLTSPELDTDGCDVRPNSPATKGSGECALKITSGSFVWGEGPKACIIIK